MQQVKDVKNEFNQAIDRTKGMYVAMDKLQNKIRLSTAIGAIAPLSALGLAAIAGAIVYGWGLRMYWGDAGNYLTVVKENRSALTTASQNQGRGSQGLPVRWCHRRKSEELQRN